MPKATISSLYNHCIVDLNRNNQLSLPYMSPKTVVKHRKYGVVSSGFGTRFSQKQLKIVKAVTNAYLESSTMALQGCHRRGTANKERNIRQNLNYH